MVYPQPKPGRRSGISEGTVRSIRPNLEAVQWPASSPKFVHRRIASLIDQAALDQLRLGLIKIVGVPPGVVHFIAPEKWAAGGAIDQCKKVAILVGRTPPIAQNEALASVVDHETLQFLSLSPNLIRWASPAIL